MSIKKLKYKSKIIFIFLFYLVLILNQIFNLKFVSNKNIKSNYNKQNFNLLINLNKNNNNIFLDNLINFYLPNIKNFKVLSKNTLINGNLNFKINNLFDIMKFKFNSLFNDQIFIINIKTTSLNNFLSYSLLSLYLLPIKY
jgi:ribosomal protein L5